jgi:hypothetical protein
MWRMLLCGLVGMVFQQTSSALTVSDSFNSAPAGEPGWFRVGPRPWWEPMATYPAAA